MIKEALIAYRIAIGLKQPILPIIRIYFPQLQLTDSDCSELYRSTAWTLSTWIEIKDTLTQESTGFSAAQR